jgi:hypothetical protein
MHERDDVLSRSVRRLPQALRGSKLIVPRRRPGAVSPTFGLLAVLASSSQRGDSKALSPG